MLCIPTGCRIKRKEKHFADENQSKLSLGSPCQSGRLHSLSPAPYSSRVQTLLKANKKFHSLVWCWDMTVCHANEDAAVRNERTCLCYIVSHKLTRGHLCIYKKEAVNCSGLLVIFQVIPFYIFSLFVVHGDFQPCPQFGCGMGPQNIYIFYIG